MTAPRIIRLLRGSTVESGKQQFRSKSWPPRKGAPIFSRIWPPWLPESSC